MRLALAALALLLLLAPLAPAHAGNRAHPLPASLTEDERALLAKDFAGYLKSKYDQPAVKRSRPPQDILRTPGEFEKADGLVIAWEGYDEVLVPLAVEASKDVKVYIGCSSSYIASAKSTLVKAGAKEENLVFVPANLDSVWVRDYGPFSILSKSGKPEIVDCLYNRPRPNDDKFPQTLGDKIGRKVHPTKLIMPGGNFQTDGHGMVIMTDVVFDPSQGGDPNMSQAQLEKYMADFFAMKKTVVIPDMNRDGTGHCDMFSKLLDDETIIVGQYASPADGAAGNYDILEKNAALLAKTENGLGKPLKVFRIPMPKYTGTSYTFTNSTALNGKFIVPIYGTPMDEKGLEAYRKAKPGCQAIGINCSGIIHANGAIHCITQVLAAPAAKVDYRPESDRVRGDGREVRLAVETATGRAPRVTVHYSWQEEGPFESVEAEAAAANPAPHWVASIPAVFQHQPVRYFVTVEADGAVVRLPEAGTYAAAR